MLWIAFLAGCNRGDELGAVRVENDLGQDVELAYEQDGELETIGRIPEGDVLRISLTAPIASGYQDVNMVCIAFDLIARADDGTQLAVVPSPYCSLGLRLSEYAPAD